MSYHDSETSERYFGAQQDAFISSGADTNSSSHSPISKSVITDRCINKVDQFTVSMNEDDESSIFFNQMVRPSNHREENTDIVLMQGNSGESILNKNSICGEHKIRNCEKYQLGT